MAASEAHTQIMLQNKEKKKERADWFLPLSHQDRGFQSMR